MNNKQLITAWIVGILVSCIFIYNASATRVRLSAIIVDIMPCLIIGGLFFYTFRDKKK